MTSIKYLAVIGLSASSGSEASSPSDNTAGVAIAGEATAGVATTGVATAGVAIGSGEGIASGEAIASD